MARFWMTAGTDAATSFEWRVRGSYFESCNCEAICPCRSVGGREGGPSSWGECFGTLSWQIQEGHAGAVGLDGRTVVMSLSYSDRVQPSTPWKVVLYVDEGADDEQLAALAAIFLGRAGGSVAALYGPAIGEVVTVRRAQISVEHVAARKRIDVVGYLTVEAHGEASEPGDVRCGIPGSIIPARNCSGRSSPPRSPRFVGPSSANATLRSRRSSSIDRGDSQCRTGSQ